MPTQTKKKSIHKRKSIHKTKASKSKSRSTSKLKYDSRLDLIGINDPHGLYNNPLTNEPYKNLYANEITDIKGETLPNTYANVSKIWTNLIVYRNKDALVNTIINNQVILATAGTGVGKTILIPRIALHALNYKGKVVCTVPKRLPARNNATFIAKCMDVKVGEYVGYSYQGENQTNKNGVESQLIFTTTGSLISRITGSDPLLSNYDCIIVDEAHERSVETDQLLLLLKKVCKIRKDLKLIIMSATIALEKFRNYYPASQFKYGEVDAGSENTFEVKQIFTGKPTDWKKTAVDITMNLLKKYPYGDIMIFVKSGGDANMVINGIEKAVSDFRVEFIKKRQVSNTGKKTVKSGSGSGSGSGTGKTQRRTNGKSNDRSSIEAESYLIINPFCTKLEGASSKEDTKLATDKNLYKTKKNEKGFFYNRKIIVSTNVAESSLTVDGVVYIIDSGYEYEDSYEPNSRANALLEKMIAQSAVIQRKGRAGRIEPGFCFHLYSKKDFEGFQKYPTPSIEKSDITGNILDIMRMQEANTVKKMRSLLNEFIDPPHEKFIIDSLKTLEALGAITTLNDNGIITPMGLAMTKFRVLSPCFARSIIASHFYGVSRSVCDIIALAHAAGGRIGNFFTKYYPDKKKGADWNKKEFNRHKNVIKSFEHPYGDYMTMLKAYKKSREHMKQSDKKEMGKGDSIDIEIVAENVVEDDLKIAPSFKKWCKDNYLNARQLIKVKQNSMLFYRTLQDIIKPYRYERGERDEEGNDLKKKLSKKEKADIKENITIMEINSVLDEIDTNIGVKYNILSDNIKIKTQSGGFIRRIAKEEEMEKLEPNVKRFEKEDDNIMMALAIGNFVNIATLGKGQRDMYMSCFAIKKTPCKIDRDSFVRGNPKIVLFEEIFMASEDARVLKLNMVNVLPNNVWDRIVDNYGNFIKFCV